MSQSMQLRLLLFFATLFSLHADRDSVERKITEAEGTLVEIAEGAGCVEFRAEHDLLYRGNPFQVLELDNEYVTELQQSQFRKTAEYREYAALLTKLRKQMEEQNFCLLVSKSEYSIKRRGFIISSWSSMIHGDSAADYARVRNEIWNGIAMKVPGARRVIDSLEVKYETLLPLPEKKALTVENDSNSSVYAVFRIKGIAKIPSRKWQDHSLSTTPATAEFIRGEFVRFRILNKETGEIYY